MKFRTQTYLDDDYYTMNEKQEVEHIRIAFSADTYNSNIMVKISIAFQKQTSFVGYNNASRRTIL